MTAETDRAAILASLRDVEPDLELEAWTVPSLHRSDDAGLRCPRCGGVLIFERFTRLRAPPLTPQFQAFRSIP